MKRSKKKQMITVLGVTFLLLAGIVMSSLLIRKYR